MLYRTRGFWLICLSPVISLLLMVIFRAVWPATRSYLTPIIQHTELNLSIIAIQLVGLALYCIGRRRGETKSKRFPFIFGWSGVLIVWGTVAIAATAFFYYGELLPWSLEPGVRALTIWDHLQHLTWGLKGSLWIVSGLTFLKF